MSTDSVSRAQLKALQSLWGIYARHSLAVSDGDPRAARLAWASALVGREVKSFRELTGDEAARLIELLKQTLGQPVKPYWRRPRDRESARAAGRHGRKGLVVEVPMIASAEDIERVRDLASRVGMTPEDFEAWLRSHRSPLGRFGGALRTVADCNRVLWALKSMLRRAG
jgi:hypothetical protein